MPLGSIHNIQLSRCIYIHLYLNLHYTERDLAMATPVLLTVSLLTLTLFSGVIFTTSQTIIETLPGYSGTLPFKLETGYIGVGDLEEVQLFYYFIESERDVAVDPLMLWLTGGPGCSGLSALAFETGPFTFNMVPYNGSLPTLVLNPNSWTKVASIIYIDAPVGAGYSYATTSAAAYTNDTKASVDLYTFVRKFLISHPKFAGNQFYIGGDSYSGITVPLLVTRVLEGLDAGVKPTVPLIGYMLGNPVTDSFIDDNSRIAFVHRVSLISDELYEEAKLYCEGDYVNVDANNSLCIRALDAIKQCLLQINQCQILEPQCAFSARKPTYLEWDLRVREAEVVEYLSSQNVLPELLCREYIYVLGYKWANDATVQRALHVRPDTIETWRRCPKNFSTYTSDVTSTVSYHLNFSEVSGLRALIYSGDHDISVPYIGTLSWIKSLGVSLFDQWRPWYVNGQIAGYTTKFMNDHYRLTYATLKGGGHTAPQFKPKEALEMIDRFFAYYPI